MRYELGMPFTAYADGVVPASSNTTVKLAGFCARNLSASLRFLSTLTATTVNPVAPYFCCISFIQGNERRHGPHHEAQKSTYTTLPRSLSRATGSPLAAGSVNA